MRRKRRPLPGLGFYTRTRIRRTTASCGERCVSKEKFVSCTYSLGRTSSSRGHWFRPCADSSASWQVVPVFLGFVSSVRHFSSVRPMGSARCFGSVAFLVLTVHTRAFSALSSFGSRSSLSSFRVCQIFQLFQLFRLFGKLGPTFQFDVQLFHPLSSRA